MRRPLLCVALGLASIACTEVPSSSDGGPPPPDASADAGIPVGDGGPVGSDAGIIRWDGGPWYDDAGRWDPGAPCPGGCDGGTCCRVAAGWACTGVATESECPAPDLTVSPDRLLTDVTFGWESFTTDDCSVVERCVGGPGWRRLMRFSVQTPNIGTADMRLGVPGTDNPVYSRSECSGEYLFDTYGRFWLLDAHGDVVARGMKQAFCIMDTDQWSFAPDVRTTPQFDCRNQGITRGWSDVYTAGLTCQWVDVTDVAPGDYTLRVALNVDRRVAELDYENNTVEVALTVPADTSEDPLVACGTGGTGGGRDCGWTQTGTFSCTPGATASAQCGDGCIASACTGDPMLRVCPGDTACGARDSLRTSDDCRSGVYCPVATFTCPPEGRVTVLSAAYTDGEAYGCAVSVR